MREHETDFSDAYFDSLQRLEERHAWTRSMRRLTLQLLLRLSPRPIRTLLDVGCGTGLFLKEWAVTNPKGTAAGLDLFPSALRRARDRMPGRWVCGSAAALPFPDQSVDALHCADVLQHLTFADEQSAVREFFRVLRPGACAALRVRGTHLRNNIPDQDYCISFTPRSLTTQLRDAGFRVRFVSRVNFLPSLYAELQPTPDNPHAGGSAVGCITHRHEAGLRQRVLQVCLNAEIWWHTRLGIPLPSGHTIIAIAERPA